MATFRLFPYGNHVNQLLVVFVIVIMPLSCPFVFLYMELMILPRLNKFSIQIHLVPQIRVRLSAFALKCNLLQN